MVATPASLDAAVPNGIQQPLDDGQRIIEYAWRPLIQHVIWESVDAHAAWSRRGSRHDSVARASRRHKCKEYDAAVVSRTTSGHKPNTL
jgi:hypothetical protein